MTQTHNSPLETLNEIRSLMERSSRFISLSGLSGVVAGISALLGAAAAYAYLGLMPFGGRLPYYVAAVQTERWGMGYIAFFLLDAALVLLLALAGGIFFTTRKAHRKGQPIWGPLTRRLLANLALPLLAGGVFCLALFYHGQLGLIAPSTLVFYGLALINASKYTLNDIRYLGVAEMALGLIVLFLPGYGLEFWCIGFGLLHIIYGAALYHKYDQAA